MKFRLEICVDSVESAVNAQMAGAHRVELCDNLIEGGTTPSSGAISIVRENLTIGLHVIIRPRGGDFIYSDKEYEIMRRDIETCGECGVDGIVLGILKPDGSIDVDRTARLIESAHNMSVTFHRAFDMCSDPVKGLEDAITSGANRLLTSGQKSRVEEGLDLIKLLVQKGKERIIIMPGSGIDELNIEKIARASGAKEFHLTGRKVIDSEMSFRREDILMGGVPGIQEFSRKVADTEKIKKIVNILGKIK